ITAWAKVEEHLFRMCVNCMGTSDEIGAIVYYRTPTIDARLSLLDELVRARLPRKERRNGRHDHSDVKAWDNVRKDVMSLLKIRNRIAHHPVGAEWGAGHSDGFGLLGLKSWLEIYVSEHEGLRGKAVEMKPLKVDDLSIHCTEVQAITKRLDQFCSTVLSKH